MPGTAAFRSYTVGNTLVPALPSLNPTPPSTSQIILPAQRFGNGKKATQAPERQRYLILNFRAAIRRRKVINVATAAAHM